MKRTLLFLSIILGMALNGFAAIQLTPSEITVEDMTVDKYNFFVTVIATTSTGEYEVAFDVWPQTKSVIGSFSAEDGTVGYVSSYVHKTKANGSAVDMWYSPQEDASILLTVTQKDEHTCTLSGSIQADRNGTTYTYVLSPFDFAYSESGNTDPTPGEDPFRFEPAQATTIDFVADVVHFREREGYIEVTLNKMADESYDWIELKLLSDALAMPAGIYPINATGAQGSLTASKGYLDGNTVDDPCYVAIRGNKEDWGQYTPYYLESGSLTVSYNEKQDSILITGNAVSHNGTAVKITAKSYNMLYDPYDIPPVAEQVELGIDTVVITYRSDLSDSTAGTYYYTFQFSRGDDYPTVVADATLSEPMAMVEGTYSLENGLLDGLQLAQNQYDFEANMFTGSAYAWVTGELTLTKGGGESWTYAMVMTDTIGSEYRFRFSQTPHITFYPQPTVDPKEVPFSDEVKEKAAITAVFDSIVWKDNTVAKDGVLDILLTQKEADANGLRAYLHLGMFTPVSYPAAGNYPVNATEAEGTFSASVGKYGSILIPCYLLLIDDDGWAHAVWYIVDGEIRLGYDGNRPVLSGNTTSHYGSTIAFSYSPRTEGIEQVPSDKGQSDQGSCTKVLRNGQVVILRGGKVYNLQGMEIE